MQDDLSAGGGVTESLWKLFELCEQLSLAVVIALDGFEWWGNRPDLWNFWDPEYPG